VKMEERQIRTGKLIKVKVRRRIGRLISLKLWERRYGSKGKAKDQE